MKDDTEKCPLHGQSNEVTDRHSDLECVVAEKSVFDGLHREHPSSQSTEERTGPRELQCLTQSHTTKTWLRMDLNLDVSSAKVSVFSSVSSWYFME